MVLNKVLPVYLRDEAAAATAEHMLERAEALSVQLAAAADDPHQVARVLTEVAESFLRFQVVAQREAEQRAELSVAPEVVATAPFFETDIYDLAGLLRLGDEVWS